MDSLEITPKELQKLLNDNKPVFILDIRPQSERSEWYIPESIHFDAYQELKKGNSSVLDSIDLPVDKPIVTVCAAGRTSLTAAEILQSKGISARSLAGGMKAWNYAWNSAERFIGNTNAHIIQVRRAVKGCLSYVIGSGVEAIVIDASLEPEVYIDIATKNNWTITHVMDTHIHADYLSRSRELAQKSQAEHIFIETVEIDFPFTPVKDGQIIPFGNSKLKILHTPGHTWESTSYFVDQKVIFTGDTLFTDGVGRPDLKADQAEVMLKAEQLYKSLQKILRLPESTVVLPAHLSSPIQFDGIMVESTLKDLKKELKLLQLSEKLFIESTIQRVPDPPKNYLLIADLNKKGSFDGYKPKDIEVGANRCAVA